MARMDSIVEADAGIARDHLRALAQRVEVADRGGPIMGSESDLFRTFSGANRLPAASAVLCSQFPQAVANHGKTQEGIEALFVRVQGRMASK
jgi:hypothetical protein